MNPVGTQNGYDSKQYVGTDESVQQSIGVLRLSEF